MTKSVNNIEKSVGIRTQWKKGDPPFEMKKKDWKRKRRKSC
jgi:hypothetical protein